MKDFSINFRHYTCTVCVAEFSLPLDSDENSVEELSPHPHRWLPSDNPNAVCHGQLIRIDFESFKTSLLAQQEIRGSISNLTKNIEAMEAKFQHDRNSLQNAVASMSLKFVREGVQALLDQLPIELAWRRTSSSDELARMKEELKASESETSHMRREGNSLIDTERNWNEWIRTDRLGDSPLVNYSLVPYPTEFDIQQKQTCAECGGGVNVMNLENAYVGEHLKPVTNSTCKNSFAPLTTHDLATISANCISTKQDSGNTTFSPGAPGEEWAPSQLWKDGHL